MIIQLQKQNIHGFTKYIDKKNNILASKVNDKWYFQKDGTLCFTAGLVNLSCGVDILTHDEAYEEDLSLLGFYRPNPNKFEFELHQDNISCYLSLNSTGNYYLVTEYDNKYETYETNDFDELIQHIITLEDKLGIEIFATIAICGQIPIMAASSRDFVKNNLVRVKSSNIWAYGMDIKDRKDKFGTLYIQFKGSTGGPGDVYAYFDTPIALWSKGLSASSKGHWFWKYIRNNLRYKKLTGDRKGKLPNAIN